MALAQLRLPLSMDQYSGEMDWVPTAIFSSSIARLPRGDTEIALLSAFSWFVLIAFITIVEPSKIVRTKIFEISVNDQRNPSSAFSSVLSL